MAGKKSAHKPAMKPPKGMHKMPGGKMMTAAAMKKRGM